MFSFLVKKNKAKNLMAEIMLGGSQRYCGREKVIYNIMYKKIYFHNIFSTYILIIRCIKYIF